MLTFTNRKSLSGIRISRTYVTRGISEAKSGSTGRTGVLTTMPRKPNSAAYLAAASVPECHAELPRFVPRLMPDKTRSTLSQLYAPSATQSAGVPLTL